MAEGTLVTVVIEERVALLTINNPPVNILSHQVMGELQSALARLKQDAAAKVVILTGAGAHFIAGADVKEIAKLASPQEAQMIAAEGQAVITGIQRLGKPVIAAINGFCLAAAASSHWPATSASPVNRRAWDSRKFRWASFPGSAARNVCRASSAKRKPLR